MDTIAPLSDQVGVLRERFILARLGQESRFGRSDIEAWLLTERYAQRPDCDHDPHNPDARCVWCRVSRQNWFDTPSPEGWLEWLDRCVTPCVLSKCTPRVGNWVEYAPFLASDAPAVQYYVGRDRYVLRISGKQALVFSFREDSSHEGLILQPFGLNRTTACCAFADLLLGEWARAGGNAVQARETLVDVISSNVDLESAIAGRDFDLAVAVSVDGIQIIKASWVMTYDTVSRRLSFNRSEWFSRNKVFIDPSKQRTALNPRIFFHDGRPDFTAIGAQFESAVYEGELQDHQVVFAIGKECDPIVYIPERFFADKMLPASPYMYYQI